MLEYSILSIVMFSDTFLYVVIVEYFNKRYQKINVFTAKEIQVVGQQIHIDSRYSLFLFLFSTIVFHNVSSQIFDSTINLILELKREP